MAGHKGGTTVRGDGCGRRTGAGTGTEVGDGGWGVFGRRGRDVFGGRGVMRREEEEGEEREERAMVLKWKKTCFAASSHALSCAEW